MVRVCVKQDKRIIDMNYALIIAGGSGNRMGQDIPKQFMHVDNCPIIIHTMMAFQKHPDIQGIAVVCLAGWETVLQSYANQFCITKLKWISLVEPMGRSRYTMVSMV